MDYSILSNEELSQLCDRINIEILRRGTYSWWDPLTNPIVGEDRMSPFSLPDDGYTILVDEKTYTINEPSTGSIEPTRNIAYPAHGKNGAGCDVGEEVNTSAAQFNMDEVKNMIVGLSKINDINLYYGRDEEVYLGFRDMSGIQDLLEKSESDIVNQLLGDSDISYIKNDPNGGLVDRKNEIYPTNVNVEYPIEGGAYVMPSGQYDGEEFDDTGMLGPNNFYDDHGATEGDSNYHPYNTFVSSESNCTYKSGRTEEFTGKVEGGLPSTRFGTNPRNPQKGDPYNSQPVYGGVVGTCNSACTGICYTTCDSQCSESCNTTCWSRCGNACTSECGNVCTGCTTMCYMTCKTKCENSAGFSCINAGAETVKITTSGGSDGEVAQNHIEITEHTCTGCSYSCQYYPNKRTSCWDAACMGQCFTSCTTYCSTSCFGGCIANDDTTTDAYKGGGGTGAGCQYNCTANCIGACLGTCSGYCTYACYSTCVDQCLDNCTWVCDTSCGAGCDTGCTNGCTGCASCAGSCEGDTTSRACVSCGSIGGCTGTCQHTCDKNCLGWGCRSICGGGDGNGACEANCRLSCLTSSCMAECSNICSSLCSTCVNTCGYSCGACTSMCSTSCGSSCNIICTSTCIHSCDTSCVMSCSESCGGCSDLCYSCISMCIGTCSVKCQDGCTSCANTCGWWCDTSCNRHCLTNCDNMCISSCSSSCISGLTSDSKITSGPEVGPTSENYIYKNPSNRFEEKESFKICKEPYLEYEPIVDPVVHIHMDVDHNIYVDAPDSMVVLMKQLYDSSSAYSVDEDGVVTLFFDKIHQLQNVYQNTSCFSGGQCFIVYVENPERIELNTSNVKYTAVFGFAGLSPVIGDDYAVFIIERASFWTDHY